MVLAQAEGTAKTLLRVFPVGAPAPPADVSRGSDEFVLGPTAAGRELVADELLEVGREREIDTHVAIHATFRRTCQSSWVRRLHGRPVSHATGSGDGWSLARSVANAAGSTFTATRRL